MKNILILVLCVAAVSTLNLKIGQRLTLDEAYRIACQQAQGQIQYQALNLPAGIQLNGNTLEITNYDIVKNGQYPVTLRARDEAGHIDSRNVIISVQVSAQVNADSAAATNIAGAATNMGGFDAAANLAKIQASLGLNGQSTTTPASQVSSAPIVLPTPDLTGVNDLLNSLQIPVDSTSTSTTSATTSTSDSTSTSTTTTTTTVQTSSVSQIASRPAFPTGTTSQIPNLTPILISDSRATKTDATRNKITVDDVATRAAFVRQTNAGYALANLLAIVKQTTANKNAANQQITTRQTLYEQAVKRQRDTQNALDLALANLRRLKTGISTVTTTVTTTTTKINDINGKVKAGQDTLVVLNKNIFDDQTKLNNADATQASLTNTITITQSKKQSRITQCNNFDQQITTINGKRTTTVSNINNLQPQINRAQNKVNADIQRINDLQAQLRDAQAALSNSQSDLNSLNAQNNGLQADLTSIDSHLTILNTNKNQCQPDINKFDETIKELNDKIIANNKLKDQINKNIANLTSQITVILNYNKAAPAQIAQLSKQTVDVQKKSSYLGSQIAAYQIAVNNAQGLADSAAEEVRAARQNLDAASKRYADENNNLSTATKNLQLARTEKEQADEAVNQLLILGANILPFAAAPDASTFGTAIRDGAYSIQSWPEFVKTVYGTGVKPIFTGDLNSLYSYLLPGQGKPNGNTAAASGAPASGAQTGTDVPASGADSTTGAPAGSNTQGAPVSGSAAPGLRGTVDNPSIALNGGVLPAGQCQVANQSSISGYLSSVTPGVLKLNVDGGSQFNVIYEGCTQAVANKDNYVPKTGDIVVVKGVAQGNVFKATHCAFAQN